VECHLLPYLAGTYGGLDNHSHGPQSLVGELLNNLDQQLLHEVLQKQPAAATNKCSAKTRLERGDQAPTSSLVLLV
jgi:hypothetical protein